MCPRDHVPFRFSMIFNYELFLLRRFTNEPVKRRSEKALLQFLIPSLGSAMVMSIYTLTDAIVIGKGVGANATLYPYAMSYMHYINMFLPVAVFSNFVAIFVRADNDPNRAMAGVLLGGVFNIVMDIVLVFPLKQGIGGAALASVVGMLIQVLVASSHFLSKKNELRFIMPHRILNSMKNIVTAGIPSFFNEFANGFIVLLFNIQILKYCGENALSIYSVISNCVILFNSLFTGVGQSVQPVISTNYGANNIGRIKALVSLPILGPGHTSLHLCHLEST